MSDTPDFRRDGHGSYLPQVDGLRAVAVFAVLLGRFLPPGLTLLNWIPSGPIGVRLFFVISGYLITGILLRGAYLVDLGQVSKKTIAWRFYIRRFLRIFPVFYLTIAVATILNMPNMRESFWWHVTYLSNVWVCRHGMILPCHFWSLAVEEHFYLIWPALVLLLPKRWLTPACIAGIFLAVAYRFIVAKMGGWLFADLMMPGCLDSLGGGALLAIVREHPDRYFDRSIRALTFPVMLLGVMGWVTSQTLMINNIHFHGILNAVQDLFLAMIFVWLVDRAREGFQSPAGSWLGWRPLVYVGRISYGIYLFHLFVGGIVIDYFKNAGIADAETRLLTRFIIPTVATILLASVSWFLFEKPINNLKRFFPYGPRRVKLMSVELDASVISKEAVANSAETV